MAKRTTGATRERVTRRPMLDIYLARAQRRRTTSGELWKYLDALPVAALVADNTGTYVMANQAAARMVGYTVQELRGLSVWDLVPTSQEHDAEVLWRHFIGVKTQRGTIKLRTKKGDLIDARYVAKAHVLPGCHLSLMSVRV